MAFRPGGAWGAHSYLCARHAKPHDLPIPSAVAFRRVRVTALVDFAGTSWAAPNAHIDAVEHLREAVATVGGVLNLVGVTSAIGRYSGQLDQPATPATAGKG